MVDSAGVEALDDYTVQFTLESAAGFFPAIAGMWVSRPMPQAVIEEKGERWVEPGFIVTNGPYALEEWAHDDHLNLVKNPLYYDADNVQIERIEGIHGPGHDPCLSRVDPRRCPGPGRAKEA